MPSILGMGWSRGWKETCFSGWLGSVRDRRSTWFSPWCGALWKLTGEGLTEKVGSAWQHSYLDHAAGAVGGQALCLGAAWTAVVDGLA